MHPNDGRVVSTIVQASRPGHYYGDGSQTRSFCYVDDLVTGLILMMEADDSIIGPINLGNPVEQTIEKLSTQIVALIGSKSKIIFKDMPQDDPKRRKPDIAQATRLLKWSPKHKLEQGLKPLTIFR